MCDQFAGANGDAAPADSEALGNAKVATVFADTGGGMHTVGQGQHAHERVGEAEVQAQVLGAQVLGAGRRGRGAGASSGGAPGAAVGFKPAAAGVPPHVQPVTSAITGLRILSLSVGSVAVTREQLLFDGEMEREPQT